jgi:DNA-binding NarL/FixJ family response regulator
MSLEQRTGFPLLVAGGQDDARREQALRVLHIEDDPSDALLIRSVLSAERPGFDLEHAQYLEEGLRMLAICEFDVVLLDLTLPETVGPATVEAVRAAALHTPIVVLTGDERFASPTEVFGADADEFLSKGDVSGPVLARAIRHSVERRRLVNEIRAQKDRVEASQEKLRVILSTISDGVVVIDRTGRVLYCNPAAADLSGMAIASDEPWVVRNLTSQEGPHIIEISPFPPPVVADPSNPDPSGATAGRGPVAAPDLGRRDGRRGRAQAGTRRGASRSLDRSR